MIILSTKEHTGLYCDGCIVMALQNLAQICQFSYSKCKFCKLDENANWEIVLFYISAYILYTSLEFLSVCFF